MTKVAFIFLQHILDSILRIEHSLKNVTKDEFLENIDLQDATVRRLEVIGEAAKNVSDEFRRNYSAIQWKEMAGMRDRLAHHYFGVNLERVWSTVKDDLPLLKRQIQMILKDRNREDNSANKK